MVSREPAKRLLLSIFIVFVRSVLSRVPERVPTFTGALYLFETSKIQWVNAIARGVERVGGGRGGEEGG